MAENAAKWHWNIAPGARAGTYFAPLAGLLALWRQAKRANPALAARALALVMGDDGPVAGGGLAGLEQVRSE